MKLIAIKLKQSANQISQLAEQGRLCEAETLCEKLLKSYPQAASAQYLGCSHYKDKTLIKHYRISKELPN